MIPISVKIAISIFYVPLLVIFVPTVFIWAWDLLNGEDTDFGPWLFSFISTALATITYVALMSL